jgi:chemotaxis receptor (MCP) glutamine deamidase CheD
MDAPRPTTIHIGGVFAGGPAADVRTVLGSCVAACLYDPLTRLGGMNHFMLPGCSGDSGLPTRYGVHAMEVLINKLMKLGADRRRLMAKIFGGANLSGFGALRVGSLNAEFVLKFLETEGIPVVAKRLGGERPIALHFFTKTAEALVRPVGLAKVGQLVAAEKRAETKIHRSLVEPADDAGVTLFDQAAGGVCNGTGF